MKSISSLIKDAFKYNSLTVINAGVGFLFIIMLGRHFKIRGGQTDIYFYLLAVTTYLSYFPHMIWQAITPYYMEYKCSNEAKKCRLYCVVFSLIIMISLSVIISYYITIFVLLKFEFIKLPQTIIVVDIMNVFVWYVLVFSLLQYNKLILNLEGYYSLYYIVDILINSVMFLSLVIAKSIKLADVVYLQVSATLVMVFLQHYFIRRVVKQRYLVFCLEDFLPFKVVYFGSSKISLGSFAYGFRSLLLAHFFMRFGPGVLSLFSYANKFSSVVNVITASPFSNIYAVEANKVIRQSKFSKIRGLMTDYWVQVVPLLLLLVLIIYFMLPYIMEKGLGKSFPMSDMRSIKEFYILLSLIMLTSVVFTPYSRIINILKGFNYSLAVNVLFILIMLLGYYCLTNSSNYYSIMFVMLGAQFVSGLLAYVFYFRNVKLRSADV